MTTRVGELEVGQVFRLGFKVDGVFVVTNTKEKNTRAILLRNSFEYSLRKDFTVTVDIPKEYC